MLLLGIESRLSQSTIENRGSIRNLVTVRTKDTYSIERQLGDLPIICEYCLNSQLGQIYHIVQVERIYKYLVHFSFESDSSLISEEYLRLKFKWLSLLDLSYEDTTNVNINIWILQIFIVN